jgi:hypothetical protein
MLSAKVTGLPDLKEALATLVPKLRVRALRNALAAGARLVQASARAATPVISPGALAVRKGYRKPGTVKKAISVRTSKLARRNGDVGVFVNVRPAKPGQRGARNPNDPFYWRFINWDINPANFDSSAAGRRERRRLNSTGGPKRRPGAKFLERGATRLGDALALFISKIGPAIARLNRPKSTAP